MSRYRQSTATMPTDAWIAVRYGMAEEAMRIGSPISEYRSTIKTRPHESSRKARIRKIPADGSHMPCVGELCE